MEITKELLLNNLLMLRMEMHHQKREKDKTEDEKERETKEVEEHHRKLSEVLEKLGKKDRKIVNQYCDHISDKLTGDNDFYYKAGFQDGIRLMVKLMKFSQN